MELIKQTRPINEPEQIFSQEYVGTAYRAKAQLMCPRHGDKDTTKRLAIPFLEYELISASGRDDNNAVAALCDMALADVREHLEQTKMYNRRIPTEVRLIIRCYALPDGLFQDGFVVEIPYEGLADKSKIYTLVSRLDFD